MPESGRHGPNRSSSGTSRRASNKAEFLGRRDLLFAVVCVAGLLALVARIAPQTKSPTRSQVASQDSPAEDARQAGTDNSPVNTMADERALSLTADEAEAVATVDQLFQRHWQQSSLEPAQPADVLSIARRLSLALTGTIPSLAEVRALENVPPAHRLAWWREELFAQRRTADYLAERMARPLVGIEDGPFLIFRRRRFVTWLADALAENRPYDAVVRELISSSGLWTDQPATNFLTAAWLPDEKRLDANRLASRVSRAFLGTRIDCAECHDHPFDRWKQHDFHGLANFFVDTRQGATGIYDPVAKQKATTSKKIESPDQIEATTPTKFVAQPPQRDEPSVPFAGELLPKQGPPRTRLAAWVTDPHNKPLPRVTVNRLWGIVFGRALVEPIDSIPLPDVSQNNAPLWNNVLELLAEDFARHGFNLRRTLRVLTALEVFRLDSRAEVVASEVAMTEGGPEPESSTVVHWNVFPFTRLRPEQLAYSIAQASSLETIDPQSSPLMAFIRSVGRAEFVRRFGDAGEAELSPAVGTIPQQLLLLNGKAVREATKGVNPVNASWCVAALSPDDERAVEAAYLTVLSRLPTPDERRHFVARLAGNHGNKRHLAVEDLFWTLLNATEFAWNH
jgi:hypothetical protein